MNEDTGKKQCEYKSWKSWRGSPCPKCFGYYDCLPIKKDHAATTRVTLGQATMDKHKAMVYYSTGIPELDKVLGGGVVYGKLIMVGAPRGAGKTSILLQACNGFAKDGRKAYFASGEMDGNTNIDYAKRLGIVNDGIHLFCNPEGIDVDDLFDRVLETQAKLVVLDSIQLCTVGDVKGDIGQATMIDAAINMLSSFGQAKRRAILIISHLNKMQDFAGTEKGQHLVDGLMRLEIKYAQDADGRPKDVGIREISMDGKSRQGRSDITSLVELTDTGIKTPSTKALRELSKLHLAPG